MQSIVVLFVGSIGWGVAGAFTLVRLIGPGIDDAIGSRTAAGPALAFWILLALTFGVVFRARSLDARVAGPGVLFGFDLTLAWLLPHESSICGELLSVGGCVAPSGEAWLLTLFLGLFVAVAMLPLFGRGSREQPLDGWAAATAEWDRERVSSIAQVLGVGLVITAVDAVGVLEAEPATEIRAIVTSGLRVDQLRVSGETEGAAWRSLAEAVLALHNGDQANVRYWAPGA
jgi:hypothetical protein